MIHLTLSRFYRHYRRLPKEAQELADKSFELLKADHYHPSLHFKMIGGAKQVWSVRVGAHYRALDVGRPEGICVVLDRKPRQLR
jgi:hypothetical protein